MAVYTHVDLDSLNRFLAEYDVGQPVAFKGIAEGVENSNYYLQTTKARFILTLYERRANADDLPFFLEYMEHLAAQGITSPLPVKNKKNHYLQKLNGKMACLITFLEGVSVDTPNTGHTGQVGRALATLHHGQIGYDGQRENDLSLSGWTKLAKDIGQDIEKITPGLRSVVDEELKFLHQNWPTDLPNGIIHADLFPDNVLFTNGQLSGLIDFYFAANDFFAYDLAVTLNAWCFDTEQNFLPAHAKAMIESYDGTRVISPQELEALPILCRGAALRFLLTRAYDWLNPVKGAVVQTKDPLDYLKRLEFHRTVKDAADYVF